MFALGVLGCTNENNTNTEKGTWVLWATAELDVTLTSGKLHQVITWYDLSGKLFETSTIEDIPTDKTNLVDAINSISTDEEETTATSPEGVILKFKLSVSPISGKKTWYSNNDTHYHKYYSAYVYQLL